MIEEWLVTALAWCDYAEDVHALEHFVFHARLNGASNMCLLCMRSHAVRLVTASILTPGILWTARTSLR